MYGPKQSNKGFLPVLYSKVFILPVRQNSIVTSTPGFCSCLSDGSGCPDGGGDDGDQPLEGEGRRGEAGTR